MHSVAVQVRILVLVLALEENTGAEADHHPELLRLGRIVWPARLLPALHALGPLGEHCMWMWTRKREIRPVRTAEMRIPFEMAMVLLEVMRMRMRDYVILRCVASN